MDFEPSEKSRAGLQKLQQFMDEHIYPNDAAYWEQLGNAAIPSRTWPTTASATTCLTSTGVASARRI
ncbi:MAG: hypothetical protein ABI574_18110 [Burkholderiales bacterium]